MCFVSTRSKSQCRLRPEEVARLELVLDVLGLEVLDPLDVVSLLDAAVALKGDISLGFNKVVYLCANPGLTKDTIYD